MPTPDQPILKVGGVIHRPADAADLIHFFEVRVGGVSRQGYLMLCFFASASMAAASVESITCAKNPKFFVLGPATPGAWQRRSKTPRRLNFP